MSGRGREEFRSRGRNVRAETTTSLLPGGGAGLLVARGGGPVKRTLSTRATSPSRWNHTSSFIWRVTRASRWLRFSSSALSRAAVSLVCAIQATARNKERMPQAFDTLCAVERGRGGVSAERRRMWFSELAALCRVAATQERVTGGQAGVSSCRSSLQSPDPALVVIFGRAGDFT